jgi:flagellar basal body-associated protein FliL
MFEPLEDTEKKSAGRSMKIIWIVIGVVAVVLAIVSFMNM